MSHAPALPHIGKIRTADGSVPLGDEQYRAQIRFDTSGHAGNEANPTQKFLILGLHKVAVENRAVVFDIDRPWTSEVRPAPPFAREPVAGTTAVSLGAKSAGVHSGLEYLDGQSPS